MVFKIQLAHAAVEDIAEAVDYISGDSVDQAQKWFDELFAALSTLREFPNRHGLIPEAKNLKRDLRSIHHHSHRVIYEVHESVSIVYVVRVYHGARKPLRKKDIT